MDNLWPLPKEHPRAVECRRAELAHAEALATIRDTYKLTPSEEFQLLSEAMRSLSMSCVSRERRRSDDTRPSHDTPAHTLRCKRCDRPAEPLFSVGGLKTGLGDLVGVEMVCSDCTRFYPGVNP